MRIGIDARMVGASGIGRYIESLITHIIPLDTTIDFVLFLREPHKIQGANVTIIKADIPWYSMQEQMRLLGLFQGAKLNLLHVPHFNVPLFYRDPFVVTIHDLTHTKISASRATTLTPWLYRAKRLAYQRVITHAVQSAKCIITVSNAVRQEVLAAYHVPFNKVVVTHEAVENDFCHVRRQRLIVPPYFFYVGNAHPHKNLERLLRAFMLVRKQHGTVRLVLAGKDHFFWQRLKNEAVRDGLGSGVEFVGGISDEKLEAYYQHAIAYVFPSISEGFGLPILEALQCGTRVIASDIAVLREVGGTVATYVDPYNEQALADAMLDHLGTKPLSTWSKRVSAHIHHFSWQELARKTLSIYREALAS